jgi:hypothetical protein
MKILSFKPLLALVEQVNLHNLQFSLSLVMEAFKRKLAVLFLEKVPVLKCHRNQKRGQSKTPYS